MTENVSDEVRSMIERKRAEAAEKRRQILAGRTNTDAPNVPQPQVHIAEDPPAVSTSSMIPPPIQGIGRNQKATRSVAPIIIRRSTKTGVTISLGSVTFGPQTSNMEPKTQPQQHRDGKKEVEVSLSVLNNREIKVEFTYLDSIVAALSTLPSHMRFFNAKGRYWIISFNALEMLRNKLAAITSVNVVIKDLPAGVKRIFADEIAGRSTTPQHAIPSTSGAEDTRIEGLDAQFTKHLFPYQRKGVRFGIKKEGRVLIADEMGLGKSIQALGVSLFYQREWPLLIVCPASVKPAWRGQITTFAPNISYDSIYMIESTKSKLPTSRNTSTVIITSYDLMVRRKKEFLDLSIYVIIFDECHMLKSHESQRSKIASLLSKKATRVILLSGTPAPSRPSELFMQIKLVDDRLYPNFRQFADRYCGGRFEKFGYRADGATNTEELSAVMEKTMMIRRLKKDVLTELPDKRRELVFLRGESIDTKMKSLVDAREACVGSGLSKNEQRYLLMQYYRETAIVKADSVAEYIIDTYFWEGAALKKMLIFAHHKIVMDKIDELLTAKGVEFIRIDGRTTGSNREAFCKKFQEEENVQVALLSITAAGTGITLTAASRVVFAELNWNPMTMMQAEDRAHRYGQKNPVTVQYMLARNTADDNMWVTLEKKLHVLGRVNLSGSDDYKTADKAHRDLDNHMISEYFSGLDQEMEDV